MIEFVHFISMAEVYKNQKTMKILKASEGLKIPYGKNDYVLVMAIRDGYVMARRKGCFPFVRQLKQFEKEYLHQNRFNNVELKPFEENE